MGLVHARRRHEEELLGAALLRERGDGADRVEILAVVVHDDIELRSSSLRGELTGVRPHGLDTSGRELVEVRERGLQASSCRHGANRVQGNRVARAARVCDKADVGVAATVGVDDEHLLGATAAEMTAGRTLRAVAGDRVRRDCRVGSRGEVRDAPWRRVRCDQRRGESDARLRACECKRWEQRRGRRRPFRG